MEDISLIALTKTGVCPVPYFYEWLSGNVISRKKGSQVGNSTSLDKGSHFLCPIAKRNLCFVGSACTFALLLEQSNLFQCFISVQSLKAEEQELSRQVINKKCWSTFRGVSITPGTKMLSGFIVAYTDCCTSRIGDGGEVSVQTIFKGYLGLILDRLCWSVWWPDPVRLTALYMTLCGEP